LTIYLLNAPVIPINYDQYTEVTVKIKKVTIDEVRGLLKNNPFVSAVGHIGTAQLLSEILEIQVPVNRITVQLEKGDVFIAFVLKKRLPEGVVLTKEQLQQLEYWFVEGEVINAI
jgi:hypothetical protein